MDEQHWSVNLHHLGKDESLPPMKVTSRVASIIHRQRLMDLNQYNCLLMERSVAWGLSCFQHEGTLSSYAGRENLNNAKG